jgi:hypothetical protein
LGSLIDGVAGGQRNEQGGKGGKNVPGRRVAVVTNSDFVRWCLAFSLGSTAGICGNSWMVGNGCCCHFLCTYLQRILQAIRKCILADR